MARAYYVMIDRIRMGLLGEVLGGDGDDDRGNRGGNFSASPPPFSYRKIVLPL